MVDRRRTRWVAHDVYFLDEPLGHAMFERFGGVGVALWFGFISACKRYHIEGSCSWSSTEDALNTFGLPGMDLVDNDGVSFEFSDWLGLLSDHKVIRRTTRGRRVKVVCTRWGRWQQAARSSRKAERQAKARNDAGQHNPRSEGVDTGTPPERSGHEGGPEGAQITDTDTDTDKDLKPLSTDVDPPDDGFRHFWDVWPKRNGKKLAKDKAHRAWARLTLPERRDAFRAAKNYADASNAGMAGAKDAFRWLQGREWSDWQEPAVRDTPGSADGMNL